MSDPLLVVANIGKAFHRYKSPWHQFGKWVGLSSRPAEAKWVLEDINFSIMPGEAVGLIGRNGAGKSTLLKMVVNVQEPTVGAVHHRGTIAAILELGMGFHNEFTGRENARYAASLLGHDHARIEELMPFIEDFCELGDYFDQPLRTYSSGMQMRLAFSVATASKPDLFIVDEALSVGDAYFQHKSFDRLKQLLREGASLLLVSHDRGAIQSICSRAILIDEGHIKKDGPAHEVLDFYNALIGGAIEDTIKIEANGAAGGSSTVSGTLEVVLASITMMNDKSIKTTAFETGATARIVVDVDVKENVEKLVLGFMIRDLYGHIVFGTNTHMLDQVLFDVTKGDKYTFEIDLDINLGPGSYSVSTALCDDRTHLGENYEWRDNALVFDVTNSADSFIGSTSLPCKITSRKTVK